MNNGYIKNLKTPIAIAGLGKSGNSALNLLLECGFKREQIILFDEKAAQAEVSVKEELIKLNPQTLVVSPGVPLNSSWITELRNRGCHVTSEISIAASLLSNEKIIGITGSVGKSTVTSLLGVGALSFDPNAFVGGNLGTPFSDYALKKLRTGLTAKWLVLELSSYQLENCALLKLEHSIITFLSANHLERYKSIEDYYKTKFFITQITSGTCLLNKTSEDCVQYSNLSQSNYRLVNAETFAQKKYFAELSLIGSHNKDNFALAAEMALLCGWPPESIYAMTQYKGLAHRLEHVATLNGVTYINDSKATAMDSVLVASKGCLEGISGENKLLLLLGGKDKNLPWEQLSVLSSNEAVTPVFFGQCGQLAKSKSELTGEYFEHLGSAVHYAMKRSKPGDVVLLSPGGTSLDEFKNFEERGDFFKTLVLSEKRN
jgi:UDP-N-acetylmuramoylalanine--D-glutamate ligase